MAAQRASLLSSTPSMPRPRAQQAFDSLTIFQCRDCWNFASCRSLNIHSLPMDCSHIQFRYTDTLDAAQLQQLIALFQAAAFWASDRTAEDMAIAIAHSHPVVTVWDHDRLIGFSRATSDGVFRATIWDVVIHPDYQGAGLGRKIVQTVLSHPLMSRIERVYLMTTNQQTFYERIGFEENQTTTMVLFHREIEPVPSLSTVEVGAREQWAEVE
jgi:N-acetylglutamate synthase-like GNAT family acetyltransferase